MQRNEVNAISTEVLNILREAQKQGKLQGYDIKRGSGRFSDAGFDMKISITPQRTPEDIARIASTQTDELVQRGLAAPGTPIISGTQRGVIVKARRTRYLVNGIGGRFDGKQFTTPFAACRLDKTAATANA